MRRSRVATGRCSSAAPGCMSGPSSTSSRSPARISRRVPRFFHDTETAAGLASVHARLGALDPVAAARIEPNNRRRIVRALEVIALTGRAVLVVRPRPRHVRPAGARCRAGRLWMPARRVGDAASSSASRAMRADGLVDEVRALAAPAGRLSRTAAQAIGYKEILAFSTAPSRRSMPRSTSPYAAPGSSPAASGSGSAATRGSTGSGAARNPATSCRPSWHSGRVRVPARTPMTACISPSSTPPATTSSSGSRSTARRDARRRRPSRALCDRHRGIGADGLITVTPAVRRRRLHDDARQRRRRARRDERERDPLPRVGRRRGAGSAADERAHRRHRRRTARGRARPATATRSSRPTVDMGAVTFDPAEIPVDVPSPFDLEATVHGVTYRGDAASDGQPASRAASSTIPQSRGSRRTGRCSSTTRASRTARTSSSSRSPAPDALTMRVWERGVGETLSCGTGACAAAAVAHRRGLVGDRVQVDVPGGDARGRARRHRAPRRSGRARLRRRDRHRVSRRVRRRDLVGRTRTASAGASPRPRSTSAASASARCSSAPATARTTSRKRRRRSTSSCCSPIPRAPSRSTRVLQRRTTPDPATYIGKGKAEELRELARGARRRRRDLRRRAHARAAAQPREDASRSTSSTASR